MKTVGLIGGTTWISTIEYYRAINRLTNERLGGINSAKILLYSLNMGEILTLINSGEWETIGDMLSKHARQLENVGADCILLCANTLHKLAGRVQAGIGVPLIHLAEATAREIVKQKITRVALLGTRFTMEEPFFADTLSQHGIQTNIPDQNQREFIHSSILNELGRDIFRDETKKKYIDIIKQMQSDGAGGIILGCTEIPLLVKQSDSGCPLFDTTLIHARAAVNFALDEPLS